MMTLAEAAVLMASRYAAHAVGEARVETVGTDSRAIVPGQLFVALRGERFDGHDFVEAALAAGAAAVMVDACWEAEHAGSDAPRLVVDDTRLALGALAAGWRDRFNIPLIGITGSNGKTTVKEMCASILSAWFGKKDAVLATRGNFNNDIGLPLTLLGLRMHHRAAVIEMGMNHPGEIAVLAGLARPTVALVNNAQRAHLEGMGSLDAVAREKGCIYDGLIDDGVAVVNADDVHADGWLVAISRTGCRTVTFGMEKPATVRGRCEPRDLESMLWLDTPWGQAECALRLPGIHNALNALAAAAACLSAGTPLVAVAEGLSGCGGAHGRLQRRAGPRGALLLDDTYNANPDSVRAGIDVLAHMPGRTVFVFGDMGEVGETSARAHAEVGAYARDKGVGCLYAFGDMSENAVSNFGVNGRHFSSVETLVEALAPSLDAGDTVLVKGSRFMRMERVVEALAAFGSPVPHPAGGKS
ncbi:MAG: UDP-N-acetylmuramoyl-tripeptide--D-alanyl-D-alanine ligase [Azoarcus sp.]|jgi:UDP-N-acetylmuramoyl-tripeptide--D-alanyl-D-alanine ligase|nr:UDP-N-acetylmuramoyl-tripeptide--D-alanyl-D-alanine ligase [Azoarcus sp.]